MTRESVIHRRHAEEERRLPRFDLGQDLFRPEASVEDRRRAIVERAVETDAEAVHVEERQREQ